MHLYNGMSPHPIRVTRKSQQGYCTTLAFLSARSWKLNKKCIVIRVILLFHFSSLSGSFSIHFSCSCSITFNLSYLFRDPCNSIWKIGFHHASMTTSSKHDIAQALSPSVRHRYQRLTGRLLRKNATRNSRNSHSNTGPWSTKHWPHQRLEALGSCHPKSGWFSHDFHHYINRNTSGELQADPSRSSRYKAPFCNPVTVAVVKVSQPFEETPPFFH